MRGLFEIALHRGWPTMAYRLLGLCKMLDKRLWGFENPLRQFTILNQETLVKLEDRKAVIDRLRDMTADEIGKVMFTPPTDKCTPALFQFKFQVYILDKRGNIGAERTFHFCACKWYMFRKQCFWKNLKHYVLFLRSNKCFHNKYFLSAQTEKDYNISSFANLAKHKKNAKMESRTFQN